jgi:hypothetical protein
MSWAAGLSRGINTYMGMKQDERDEQARLRMMDEEDKRWERRAQKSAQIEQKYREVADAKARAREVIFQNINPETGALEQFTAADADKGLPVPQSILSQQRAEAERAGVEADRKARLDEAEINRRQQVGQGAAARGQAAMIRAQQAGQGGGQGGISANAEAIARTTYERALAEGMSPMQAREAAAQVTSPAVVERLFPARAEQAGAAIRSADEILQRLGLGPAASKYLQ